MTSKMASQSWCLSSSLVNETKEKVNNSNVLYKLIILLVCSLENVANF